MASTSQARKRKRSTSALNPSLPPETINPHSHSQHTLKQFAVAGLAQDEPLPSDVIPGFPHRPLPRSSPIEEEEEEEGDDDDGDENGETPKHASDDDDDDDDEAVAEAEAGAAATAAAARVAAPAARWRRRAHERTAGVLAAAVRRALAAGDLGRAARAFGLLVRAKVRGRRVDLRHDGYWVLGAEVLMRQAAAAAAAVGAMGDADAETVAVDRVRSYLEALAQSHPYNHIFPGVTSALDFYPALFAYETDAAYQTQKRALERLEAEVEAGEWDDGIAGDMDLDVDGNADGDGFRRDRLRQEKERLRLAGLQRLRDIARRMDELMEGLPYSKDHEMLRLRGMLALYMSDLCLPALPRTDEEDRDGKVARERRKEEARRMFRRIVEAGGELDDQWIREFVDPPLDGEEDEEEDGEAENPGPELTMFSSLPLR